MLSSRLTALGDGGAVVSAERRGATAPPGTRRTVTPRSTPGHATVLAALAVLTIGGAGCSSLDEASVTADSAPAPTSSTHVSLPTSSDPIDDVASTGVGDGAACGGITGAAMTAAVGVGEFDEADDLSTGAATTCVFSNSAGNYAVSVTAEPSTTYLAGEIEGLPADVALERLGTLIVAPMDGGATVNQVSQDGHEMVIATGIDSIVGAPAGAGAAVIDGDVIVVDVGGTELAVDASGFDPIVRNVLELVAATH